MKYSVARQDARCCVMVYFVARQSACYGGWSILSRVTMLAAA